MQLLDLLALFCSFPCAPEAFSRCSIFLLLFKEGHFRLIGDYKLIIHEYKNACDGLSWSTYYFWIWLQPPTILNRIKWVETIDVGMDDQQVIYYSVFL